MQGSSLGSVRWQNISEYYEFMVRLKKTVDSDQLASSADLDLHVFKGWYKNFKCNVIINIALARGGQIWYADLHTGKCIHGFGGI